MEKENLSISQQMMHIFIKNHQWNDRSMKAIAEMLADGRHADVLKAILLLDDEAGEGNE